ncbi:hypothetical protein INT45_001945 [Circinella minor]|uniref:Uncharacterized protein n=1 Tax=Circinella minor TaxID=1195481 RepID=A0A8H7S6Z1_9FUNG|nr:hypothetical protein INT45_001945 [Circinella minor]
MKISNILTCLLCATSLILQVISLCGNLPGLHSIYFVKVDTLVSNSLIDRIRHNIFGVPDSLTFATFVICQMFDSDDTQTACTNPSLGYRFDSQGLPGILEDAIPDKFHTALSVAQGGILIPSVILSFIITSWCLIRLCTANDRLVCCLTLLGVFALAFVIASLAVQIVGYRSVRNALTQAEQAIPGTSVKLIASLGPAIWLTVGAAIALIIVIIIFFIEGVLLCRTQAQHQRRQEQEIEMSHV